MRPLYAKFAFVLLAATLGCDDPTGVGVELIDIRSGAPQVEQLYPAFQTNHVVYDVTGNARRALLGSVEDPLVGGTRAAAALDFAIPSTLVPSADFQQGPVEYAELQLVPDYIYGDTTSTIDVSLSEIFETWTATGNSSSASIPSGPQITTATLRAADTLLVIPLPESWYKDPVTEVNLRSQDFVTLFQGFLVEPLNNGVVFGIDFDESSMLVVSGGDTLNFLLSRNLSLVSRTSPASPPPGRVVLQDGHGSGLGVEFDFASADLENVAVSRAVLRVLYDSLAADQQLPPNFVRPALTQVDFVGFTSDSVAVPLATSSVTDGVLLFDGPVLRATFQDALIGQSVFDSFALMGSIDLQPVQNTANVLILSDGTIDTDGPTMALTVIKPAER
jgi:hypothetical protein